MLSPSLHSAPVLHHRHQRLPRQEVSVMSAACVISSSFIQATYLYSLRVYISTMVFIINLNKQECSVLVLSWSTDVAEGRITDCCRHSVRLSVTVCLSVCLSVYLFKAITVQKGRFADHSSNWMHKFLPVTDGAVFEKKLQKLRSQFQILSVKQKAATSSESIHINTLYSVDVGD